MRYSLVLVALLAVPAASAQSSFFAAEFGAGSNGIAARGQAGLGRLGPVAPTVRLAMTTDTAPASAEPSYRQSNVEVGLGASRVVRLADGVGLAGGAGVAVAVAARDEGASQDGAFFRFPKMQFGLTLPLDLSAVVRLTRTVSVSAGGYWSVPLASGSSESDPDLLAQMPSLGQHGAVLGVRVGGW
ncbi:hypothetical protein [Rubricoccus marinus]|uniref:Outer membrane protein beta-barrel domain-containing protein n=1 Tax=Rubricoccus marinus TaxID=716817 RepID=A0A259U1M5_9BACT|nr:hypothetical protein [Rubricoccus marinus]OZC03748.1 hypothetical protein BSZ36_12600 [Rubricoccus marinus]